MSGLPHPLLEGVIELAHAAGTDDFAAMMGLDATDTAKAEDAAIGLKRELNSFPGRSR